jgi:hypothetical protein
MPGTTPLEGWTYPLPGEVLTRQKLQDLADAMHFSLAAVNTDRLAVLQRARGLIGATASNVFTVGAIGYMSFTVDHLDNWFNGGRAITSTQGPTLPTGLYMFSFTGQCTAQSASLATYTRVDVEFERGGTRLARRTFSASQLSWRISAPVRIPAGAPQQVKVRIAPAGSVGGSTMTVGRSNVESSPRLSWVQVANG